MSDIQHSSERHHGKRNDHIELWREWQHDREPSIKDDQDPAEQLEMANQAVSIDANSNVPGAYGFSSSNTGSKQSLLGRSITNDGSSSNLKSIDARQGSRAQSSNDLAQPLSEVPQAGTNQESQGSKSAAFLDQQVGNLDSQDRRTDQINSQLFSDDFKLELGTGDQQVPQRLTDWTRELDGNENKNASQEYSRTYVNPEFEHDHGPIDRHEQPSEIIDYWSQHQSEQNKTGAQNADDQFQQDIGPLEGHEPPYEIFDYRHLHQTDQDREQSAQDQNEEQSAQAEQPEKSKSVQSLPQMLLGSVWDERPSMPIFRRVEDMPRDKLEAHCYELQRHLEELHQVHENQLVSLQQQLTQKSHESQINASSNISSQLPRTLSRALSSPSIADAISIIRGEDQPNKLKSSTLSRQNYQDEMAALKKDNERLIDYLHLLLERIMNNPEAMTVLAFGDHIFGPPSNESVE